LYQINYFLHCKDTPSKTASGLTGSPADVSITPGNVSNTQVVVSITPGNVSRAPAEASIRRGNASNTQVDVSTTQVDVSIKQVDVSIKQVDVSITQVDLTPQVKHLSRGAIFKVKLQELCKVWISSYLCQLLSTLELFNPSVPAESFFVTED